MKVKFFNKKLLLEFGKIFTALNLILTTILIFIDIPNENKIKYAIAFIILNLIIYIFLLVRANIKISASLNINNSIVDIKVGDIFEQDSLKVIPFNEYFDTNIKDGIISDKTLNGMYILKYISDISALDKYIEEYDNIDDNLLDVNNDRKKGKKKKYSLGTIIKNNDFIYTAFSKFDDNNRAYIYLKDYVSFLFKFWDEIDKVYNGESVVIPLFGTGITRFRDGSNFSEQELLEIIIWSFKISRIKFVYPSKVTILVTKEMANKINFYKLREVE